MNKFQVINHPHGMSELIFISETRKFTMAYCKSFRLNFNCDLPGGRSSYTQSNDCFQTFRPSTPSERVSFADSPWLNFQKRKLKFRQVGYSNNTSTFFVLNFRSRESTVKVQILAQKYFPTFRREFLSRLKARFKF